MDGEEDFPFSIEYSKSNRASCKKCKEKIQKDVVRIAAMVQSPSFDGKMAQWYHEKCFFLKMRPKSVAEINHFDALRWDDQKRIKSTVEENAGTSSSNGASATKKGKKAAKKIKSDFSIEYAKSARAACNYCEEKIKKGEIRISKLDFESEKARRFGPIPRWHHPQCFVDRRDELEYYDSGADLPGFNTLSGDDKTMIRNKIKAMTVPSSKRKAEDEPDTGVSKKVKKEEKKKEEDAMQKQNNYIYSFKDKLKKMPKSDLISLLESNGYLYSGGVSNALEILADFMAFGTPKNCKSCGNGNFCYVYGKGYECNGSMSEWTKCTVVVDTPERKDFKIPKELQEEYPFLKKYKFKDIGPKIIFKKPASQDEVDSKKGIGASGQPLEKMTFVIVGRKFSVKKSVLKEKITKLGGIVSSSVSRTTAAVITVPDMLGEPNEEIDKAKEFEIQCVSEDFLDEVQSGGVVLMIEKKNIASWGSNPESRIYKKKSWSSLKSAKDSTFTKDLPDKLKIKFKGGAAVDPDSNLDDEAHVYKYYGKYYNSVLGYVNIAKGSNSYYKLQVLESDNKRSWWVFRSWGRIGTTIGSTKTGSFSDPQDAIRNFNFVYEEKVGRSFLSKSEEKVPGRWFPIDIDYEQDNQAETIKLNVSKSKSKLDDAVKTLISLIFDIERMKSTMVEYEIDLKKMPLGKISKRQLQNAFKILSEATEWLEKKPTEAIETVKSHLLDCSNKFFTLIPHDFGMNQPPLLDNEELIKTKIGMIESLQEIELAYNLLKSEGEEEEEDPFDKHYKKLKTDMKPLARDSEEFKMVETYTKNTHATTHSHYKLEIQQVFKIARDGEQKIFKPFKKLPNHKLLWHGSRLTNFAGILSQGLRIAPPEAPSTGYMFGKGVYFADMVSKSANYCSTNSVNSTGLLLLCDVALGDMYELTHSEYVTKLPKGKHSTKGQGRTCPDPSQTITVDKNVEVPLGKGIDSGVQNSSLLYNEFIVYDVSQIHVKYLVQTNFNYGY